MHIGSWPSLHTTANSAAPPFAVFEGWAPLLSAHIATGETGTLPLIFGA